MWSYLNCKSDQPQHLPCHSHLETEDKSTKIPAFGLVEAAILLVILGLVSGAGIKIYAQVKQLKQHQVTEHHREAIISSLAAYVARKGHLPCPAPRNSNNGEEARSGERCAVNRGIVPYFTLGIVKSISLDGLHRPYLYAPDPQLVYDSTGNPTAAGSSAPILGQAPQQWFCQAQRGAQALHVEGVSPDHLIAFVLMTQVPFSKEDEDTLFFSTETAAQKDFYWVTRDQFMSHTLKRHCHKPSAPESGKPAEQGFIPGDPTAEGVRAPEMN